MWWLGTEQVSVTLGFGKSLKLSVSPSSLECEVSALRGRYLGQRQMWTKPTAWFLVTVMDVVGVVSIVLVAAGSWQWISGSPLPRTGLW